MEQRALELVLKFDWDLGRQRGLGECRRLQQLSSKGKEQGS